MNNWTKGLIGVLGTIVVAMNVTACNTMEGIGKDTEKAGESLKDAARDAKD